MPANTINFLIVITNHTQQDCAVAVGWFGYRGSMRRQVVTVAAGGLGDDILLFWETAKSGVYYRTLGSF